MVSLVKQRITTNSTQALYRILCYDSSFHLSAQFRVSKGWFKNVHTPRVPCIAVYFESAPDDLDLNPGPCAISTSSTQAMCRVLCLGTDFHLGSKGNVNTTGLPKVPKFNSCTKCLGSPGNIRPHAWLPHSILSMDVWATSQLNVALIRKLRGSLICMSCFLTCHLLLCVQPSTGRRPVDWCRS